MKLASPDMIQRKKFNRSMIVLGRLILDIQRENSGATFDSKLYPDNETLKKLGLSAIGELNTPEMLQIVQEASRRDTGVKRIINRILTNINSSVTEVNSVNEVSP